jgi:hypothetical protein
MCNSQCSGDNGALCGGYGALNIYNNTNWVSPVTSTTTTTTTSKLSTTTTWVPETTSLAASNTTAPSIAPSVSPSVPSQSTSTLYSTNLITIYACAETVIECPFRSQTQTIITSSTPVSQVIHAPTVIISGGNTQTIWVPISTGTIETNVEETGIAILVPGEEAVTATAAISSSTIAPGPFVNGSVPASLVPVTAAASGGDRGWMGIMVGGITGFGLLFFLA